MKKNIKSFSALICSLVVAASCAIPATAVTRDGNSSYYGDIRADYYGWAAEAVDYLTEKGVASGIGNHLFSPDSQIKRCDFVVLLDKALKLKEINKRAYGFNDVNEDDYFFDSVINAKGNGVVTNVGSFFPELEITRIDAFIMMYKALDVQGYVKNFGSTDTSMYADEDDLVNINSKIAVGTLTSMGILHGSDGYINPNTSIERSEMAVLIYQTMKFVEEQEAAKADKIEEDVKQEIADTTEEDTENTETVSNADKTQQALIYKPTVIDTDKTLDNCTIRVSDSAAHNDLSNDNVSKNEIVYANQPAISISGQNILNLTNSKVYAYSVPAALRLSEYSTINADNSQISGSSSSGVVLTDNASFNAKNSTIAVTGAKNYALSVGGGMTEISDSKVSSSDGVAIKATEGADVVVSNTDVNASSRTGAVELTADYYDSKNGITKLSFAGCNIINPLGAAFYVNNSDTQIDLNGDCKVDAKYLLYTSNTTKKAGSTEASVTINLNNQEISGDIYMDDLTRLQFNINKGSKYEGSLNPGLESTKLDVYLSDDATLELTGDCYVAKFVIDDKDNINLQNIIDNGHTIYYDASLEENYYLDEKTYSLQYGGELKPRW